MIWILFKFIASSALLYLLFYLFLEKEKSFHLNRWVLLFIIPCAMLIPFLSLPVFLPQEVPVQTTYIKLVQNPEIYGTNPEPSPQNFSLLHLLLTVYLLVFLFLLVKKLKALSNLINWTQERSFRRIKGAFLVLSPDVHTPFSFDKYIFMHPSDYSETNEKTRMILEHELVHIREKHHLDLILMEFLTVICWFNPIVYLVKKAMVLNHEYLADQTVKHTTQAIAYKKLLLELTVRTQQVAWTISMASSSLKNRLIMMNKPLTKKTMQLRIFSFSLLSLLIIAGFSLQINARQSLPTKAGTGQSGKDQSFEIEFQPVAQGGMESYYNYIATELEYPLEARRKGIEGEVEVQFTVEKDGSLTNIKAIKGIGFGCNEEAERVIKNGPAFHPGKQRGRPVRVQMV
ncbi:TonB family protein, partial [Cyclobacterium plantarum]|uniref:TonB family protein n=1 Tax=Cyclobacterium plantarum TaxID=2716263 RepID=UPI003F6FEF61